MEIRFFIVEIFLLIIYNSYNYFIMKGYLKAILVLFLLFSGVAHAREGRMGDLAILDIRAGTELPKEINLSLGKFTLKLHRD